MRTEPLYRQLDIRPGVTAVIGSGGKTTLLRQLCRELPGRVILCTSTRIYPFEDLPLLTEPVTALSAEKVCMGCPAEHGKLSAPGQSFEELALLADFVLVEADGSHGLPLKAHLPHEPVIPACAGQTVQVLGLSGLGRPIGEAAHRPEIYARLCGAELETPVTAEMAAAVLKAENLCDRVLLNQADAADGRLLASLLDRPVVVTALQPCRF